MPIIDKLETSQDLSSAPALQLRIASLFEPYGEAIEQDGPVGEEERSPAFLNRAARNLLRFITFGVAATHHAGYDRCFALIEKGLTKKDNPALLAALLVETQALFNQLSARLVNQPTFANETHIEYFVDFLLSLLPFLNPVLGSKLCIPQKIEGRWVQEDYTFNQRFDLSPIDGPLAAILEPNDRMYDYALVPCDALSTAKNHLLLMGTTYPTGQGAGLASLENFRPRQSIGEGHHLAEIYTWLAQTGDKQTNITGHSKGGTMAMIIAATCPAKVNKAVCLNPTALHSTTLDRLRPRWDAPKPYPNPTINVFTQTGDPVFHLEKGFLSNTNIYRITLTQHIPSNYKPWVPTLLQKTLEAHIQYFIGREGVMVTPVSLEQENHSARREFLDDMKGSINWMLYPIKYAELYANIRVGRSIDRYAEENPHAGKVIHGAGFILSGLKSLLQLGMMLPVMTVTAAASGVKMGAKAAFTRAYVVNDAAGLLSKGADLHQEDMPSAMSNVYLSLVKHDELVVRPKIPHEVPRVAMSPRPRSSEAGMLGSRFSGSFFASPSDTTRVSDGMASVLLGNECKQ